MVKCHKLKLLLALKAWSLLITKVALHEISNQEDEEKQQKRLKQITGSLCNMDELRPNLNLGIIFGASVSMASWLLSFLALKINLELC